MFLLIVLIIVGLVLIIKGADILTEGSAALARRFNIPELVIGLTIISVGTSAPELVVSVLSSIEGKGDVAIGNVVGSNIFNVLGILGVASIFSTIRTTRGNITREIPFVLLSSVLLFVLACDTLLTNSPTSELSRIDGGILLLMFVLFMVYTLNVAKRYKSIGKQNDETKQISLLKTSIYIVGGLAGLVYGGSLFLDNAVELATQIGISQHIIAITLMAGGTSLPELAATISAARKGKTQMAIGNVIGSNIFNILFILGIAATISPLSLGGITSIDMGVMLLSAVLFFLSVFILGKFKIFYQDGIMFLSVYVGYIIWLLS